LLEVELRVNARKEGINGDEGFKKLSERQQ
jgi:hypothetical protein